MFYAEGMVRCYAEGMVKCFMRRGSYDGLCRGDGKMFYAVGMVKCFMQREW